MPVTVLSTDNTFPEQKDICKGMVRVVCNISDKYLLMVVSDTISAFDVVMPSGIPCGNSKQ